jgi:hypothetical protein
LYWTKFFEMLERHTVDEVYYTNFGMSGTKDVTLSAVGTGYRAAARQLVAFQQAEDFAQDVSINGATAELDLEDPSVVSVNFTVNLRLQDGVFEDPISSQP